MKTKNLVLVACAMAAGLAQAVQAAKFEPITAEQKALTAAPGYPNAGAVVLFRRGDFRMLDSARQEQSSTLTVESRIKILSTEGQKSYGEVEIFHSPFYRLSGLEGRTVLPDGRELPLDEKSVFERRTSKSRRHFVTAIAFPGVEVGAILDYRYQIRFDSIFMLEPWVLQEEVPVLEAGIVYHIPKEIGVRGWSRDPMKVGIEISDSRSALGVDVRAAARNLPPVISEPFSFPTSDLAARVMIVPIKYAGTEPLLDTWATTCELIDTYNYGEARRNNTAARRRAKELVGAASAPRDKALALYRFVRDEIATEPLPGVTVDPKAGPDSVLSARRGDYADKALLLQALLDASKLDAALVWAASRRDGIVDTALPTLAWFDRVIVRVMLDGKPVFLDPGEPGLAFGQISYDHEGTQAVVFDRRKPEVITLPSTTFDQHARNAKVVLALDDAGRLAGSGSVVFTGHHAAARIAVVTASESAEKAWQEWLEGRFKGFVVSAIQPTAAVDEQRAEVHFELAQAEEEVLGDESTFHPSRPLGPVAQPFPLPPDRRTTPVMFDFGDQDRLDLELTWPAGWQLAGLPDDRTAGSNVGRFVTTWQLDETARKLSHQRVLEIKQTQFMEREAYGLLRNLWATAEKSDAVPLTLVKKP